MTVKAASTVAPKVMDELVATENNPTTPEPWDYINPLEASSRWYVYARAHAVRYGASLGFSIGNRTDPAAPTFTREIHLDSTLSPKYSGRKKIKVEIWSPPRICVGTRPAIINFHGGGWILGSGTDDARWAGAAMSSLDAVVFTVNYRLAPGYPFPTPIEDCVDAILQITARAPEFGVDPAKIILSGFSAGGTNALASWVILQDPTKWQYQIKTQIPTIAGLCLFYPLLDWTISRPEKRQTCARPDLTLPRGLTDLIDASYIYPPVARRERLDPRMSPGLMSNSMLSSLPPVHLCLCEYDMLLHEGLRFCQRLEAHKKPFTVRIVENEKHAWDKPLPMDFKDSAAVEYGEATQAIAGWLGQDHDTDKESVSSMKTKRLRIPRPKFSLRSRSLE